MRTRDPNPVLWVTALTVLVSTSVAGCRGESSVAADGVGGGDATAGSEGCAAGESRLGGACWSASGTRWAVQADGPAGAYRFEVDLLAAGRVRSTDHPAAGPGTDEWFQEGPLLRLFLSDRFVEYRTRLTNGTVLVGEAINVRGQRWSWRGDRVFGETACVESEARLEEGCMSMGGTRWDIDGRMIQFLSEGVVAVGAEDATGTWEQTGGSIRFTLTHGEDNRAHVAELENSDALSGGFDGADGSWRASRIPTIAPVMHE